MAPKALKFTKRTDDEFFLYFGGIVTNMNNTTTPINISECTIDFRDTVFDGTLSATDMTKGYLAMIVPTAIPAHVTLTNIYYYENDNIIYLIITNGIGNATVDGYDGKIIKYEDESTGKIDTIIEKPAIEDAPSTCAGLGRYIVKPEIFDILEDLPAGKGGEIQLTDALRKLSKQEAMYAYNFEGKRYDVGDKLGFLEATVDFALKRDELKDDFIKYLKKVSLEETN